MEVVGLEYHKMGVAIDSGQLINFVLNEWEEAIRRPFFYGIFSEGNNNNTNNIDVKSIKNYPGQCGQ